MADDTQFYIIGAVILVVATNHFKIAAFTVVTLLISSWITTGYIALINNHMPSSDDPLALFDKIYDKPWTRLGPYFIGMSVGYFLFKTDCKVKMSKVSWKIIVINNIVIIIKLSINLESSIIIFIIFIFSSDYSFCWLAIFYKLFVELIVWTL